MEDQEKLKEIKRGLEEIVAQLLKISDRIKEIRKQLEAVNRLPRDE
jgi:hypothetical protein